jgi:hypothetical protein
VIFRLGFRVNTSLLKSLDRVCGPVACWIGSLLPRGAARAEKALVVRPGGMGDLIGADIALEELGRDARDFLWLIEERSRPWAEYRGLPFLCYDCAGGGAGFLRDESRGGVGRSGGGL